VFLTRLGPLARARETSRVSLAFLLLPTANTPPNQTGGVLHSCPTRIALYARIIPAQVQVLYDSRTERNTDLNPSYITLSAFPSVRERCEDSTASLASSRLISERGALRHWIAPQGLTRALRLNWSTAEISKYRPLLLKLSQVSGLRRTATRWASALPQRGACPWGRPGGTPRLQTQGSSPSNGLVQRRIVWRLLDLLAGDPLAYVICLHYRSLRPSRATQILSRYAGASQHNP
jgi:hypothetical protein